MAERLPGPDGPLTTERDQLVRACARFLAGLHPHERALILAAFCPRCQLPSGWAGNLCRCRKEHS